MNLIKSVLRKSWVIDGSDGSNVTCTQVRFRRTVTSKSICSNNHGFTLVELIMIMVIIGVLAIAVIPRFFDRGTFDSKGLYDETMAILRYAQKSAIAQRRTVCVTFTASSAELAIATNPEVANCGSANNLVSPTGASPFRVEGKRNAAYQSTPAALMFTALGRPLDASGNPLPAGGRTIAVIDAGTITVERETGYVH